MTREEMLDYIIDNKGVCDILHCEECPLSSKLDGMCRRPFIQAEGYEWWRGEKLELAKNIKAGYVAGTFTIDDVQRSDILSVCEYIISTEERDYFEMLEEHEGDHSACDGHPYAIALRVTAAFKDIKEN